MNYRTESADDPRFLSRERCEAVVRQIERVASSRGQTDVLVQSIWRSGVRWARNRTSLMSDGRDNELEVKRGELGVGAAALAQTNQVDNVSLTALVRWVEHVWREFPGDEGRGVKVAPEAWTYPVTHIWSDSTYGMPPDRRSEIANQLIAGVERAGMLSAGYLSVSAVGCTKSLMDGRLLYAPQTLAECSVTVRDPEGTGSGWAGRSSYDWSRFDAQRLADIALDKCVRSRHPVRIEPGRYTLIMEPQATFALARPLVGLADLAENESDRSIYPYHAGTRRYPISKWGSPAVIGTTKIGLRLIDERISITYTPEDPDQGVLPFTLDSGEPVTPVRWFDRGVLTELNYDRRFAANQLHEPQGKPYSGAFHMSGGTTTIEEMIATTQRGLLVTRFWGVDVIDWHSVLMKGMTRDGLWLIENGKISHPVTNLLFTESPLFAFNQVEQLGVPVPVFSPGAPAIVPPMKVRDFSFTATVDAI